MFWRNVLPLYSALKSKSTKQQAEMEAIHCSKMLVTFYQITWHHIPEDTIFHL
jgi:hypothetical protein